jgi:glycolate oxidase FAD binding subunit
MSEAAEPQTPEELAAALAGASRGRRSTAIRGGGTKSDWGRPATDPELTVLTGRLNRLVVHRHGDLTATVQAGMRLADFNAELAAYRQWLPVESAFAGTTIGGMVATTDCGPLRHRSGTPRDLLIGITLALTDGRIVKAGGHVVKNVAGYDLGRFVSGSFGTLAAIVDATFKLMPIPQASVTLVASYADAAALARDAAAMAASQLEPAAFDIRVGLSGVGPNLQLLVRFASSPASTEEQANHASALLIGEVSVMTGEAESTLWREQIAAPWSADAGGGLADAPAVIRMGWLPSRLADVIALVRGHALTGRVMGTGLVRLAGDPAGHAAIVERLRASDALRHVVILSGAAALKTQVDAWGPPASAASATRALKQMFDPAGILNAGRGPI